MRIITLLTDNGQSDHYVAAIKGKVISICSEVNIVDISHSINPFDIAQGAFVLKAVFRDFPQGTIHLVCIDAAANPTELPIALLLEQHYFVGIDNGLFGLISDERPANIAKLNTESRTDSTFPERDIFAPAEAKLASGINLELLGTRQEQLKKLINRCARTTQNSILGNVVHVDAFGNLITNISKNSFTQAQKGRPFKIRFGGFKSDKVHQEYFKSQFGEVFILFNSLNLLEIGMYKGNASELMGLTKDSPVNILFQGKI